MRRVMILTVAMIAAATMGNVNLPGENEIAKEAIGFAPFPDRMSAYVWRNWFVVDHDRMAKTVGATEAQIRKIAEEMGLPGEVKVLPEWRRKGYITVLRRNWHLLNYEQLLALLDMTREELRFKLIEDDFLWVKLGRIKPKCAELKWSESDARSENIVEQRRNIAKTLKAEGADDFSEERRFAFVDELSKAESGWQPGEKNGNWFDFRMIFSYFADYGDPLGDPNIGSYPEGLLQKLSDEGVNAVWLHTVLRTLTKDPKYSEFGERSEERIANLRKLVKRAAKYGIKVYLYMNEPRSQPKEFFTVNEERMAMRGARSGRDTGGKNYAMCVSTAEGRRWLKESVRQVFSQVKGLGGIFTITASENFTTCASHNRQEMCPHCKGRKRAELIAEANCAMIEGMREGDAKAEALVWNWGWPLGERGYADITDRLPTANCRVMGVSEGHMKVKRGGIETEEQDYSISIVGPGEMARGFWSGAKRRGLPVVAKVQANCSWELSSFPYLPVEDLVAEHAFNLMKEGVNGVMLSWSLGCAPAANLRVFRDMRKDDVDKYAVERRIAEATYGELAAPGVMAAWKAFADGFREYPFSLGVIYHGPQQWGPANPLYLKPTGWKATMVGIAYDDLKSWSDIYPAETWIAQMRKVAAGFDRGVNLFAAEVGKTKNPTFAEKELKMFLAEMLHFQSCADQAEFVLARDRGDTAAMLKLLEREKATAIEMLRLVRNDSRIGFESSNHYFYIPQDLREKIILCNFFERALRR